MMQADWVVSMTVIDKEAKEKKKAATVFSASIECIPETVAITAWKILEKAEKAITVYKKAKQEMQSLR